MNATRRRALRRRFDRLIPHPGEFRWRSFKKAFVRDELFSWVEKDAPQKPPVHSGYPTQLPEKSS